MVRYTVRRLFAAIPTLFIVLTIIFFIIRIAPGDPAVAALGDQASEAAVETVRERMGLNEPLWRQYTTFMVGLVTGDLGTSLVNGRPISRQVAAALPHTLQLTAAALTLGLLLGIPTGVLTAVRQNRPIDYIGRIFSLAGLSFPAFFLAILLMLFFSVRLGWFPSVGSGPFTDLRLNLTYLALPALSLGLIATAYITRITRSVILNILSEDYVRTAHSKGANELRVLFRHALRPALVPVVSLVGIFSISLIGSSVMTEIVFARPGLGRTMVQATLQRDYTVLQAVMAVFAVLVILINLATDLLYGWLDPKVRYE